MIPHKTLTINRIFSFCLTSCTQLDKIFKRLTGTASYPATSNMTLKEMSSLNITLHLRKQKNASSLILRYVGTGHIVIATNCLVEPSEDEDSKLFFSSNQRMLFASLRGGQYEYKRQDEKESVRKRNRPDGCSTSQ